MAAVATDAGNHILSASFHDFFIVVRVAEEGPGSGHHIRLSLRQIPLDVLRVLEAADGSSYNFSTAALNGLRYP